MTITPLGKIAVTTAGTPVRVTATATPCHAIIVSQIAASTGATHFGDSTLVASTLVGVIKTFLKPATGFGVADQMIITSPGGNLLNAADYYVDAAVNGEGLLVSVVTV